MRMLEFTAPHQPSRHLRKRRKLSSFHQRPTFAKEFSSRNEFFQIPKKRVRFHIPGKDQHTSNDDQGLEYDRMATELTTRTISNEEIKRCWYDRSDLMAFRNDAISNAFERLQKSNGNVNLLPRGMESLAPIRRKHKANALRYILLAFRLGKDQNFVGKLCAKLGRWNKDIALRAACLDYLEIYRPSSAHSVPPLMSRPPKIPFVPASIEKDLLSPSPSSRKRQRAYSFSECPHVESK